MEEVRTPASHLRPDGPLPSGRSAHGVPAASRVGSPASRIPAWFEPYRYLVKPFLVLALIFLLGISAILRANFYYLDDLGRAAWGYTEWEHFSRYVSLVLSWIIHAGGYLTDVAPLPQLIAVLFLALASVALIHVLGNRRRVSPWSIIACVPLGLSPFFLECLTYRFDAPYMALSILASVAPLLFAERRPSVYLPAAFVGTLVMCMTYQAAAGIFPMAVILVAFTRWRERAFGGTEASDDPDAPIASPLRLILLSAATYLAALVLYEFVIVHPVDDYVSTSMAPLAELLPTAFAHYIDFYRAIVQDLKPFWVAIIAAMVVAYVVTAVLSSHRSRWATFGLAIATLAAFGLLAFGVYPFLETPLVNMGSGMRALYGFGVLLALLGLSISLTPRIVVAQLFPLALSWVFFSFAFTYGNALGLQREWIDFRIEQAITTIDEHADQFGDEVLVYLEGDAGLAPALRNMPEDDLRLLRGIVTQSFGGPWSWHQAKFFDYYGLAPRFVSAGMLSPEELESYEALPVIDDGIYATMRGDAGHLLIQVKQ